MAKVSNSKGFTIVELLVVIIIIGVLVSITVFAYIGVTSSAKATAIQSDLNAGKIQIKMYLQSNGTYPTGIDGSNCLTPTGATSICLKPSPGNSYSYKYDNNTNPKTFSLKVRNGLLSYIINSESSPSLISAKPTMKCPSGFIKVPGSLTYGTGDFCVMKYEAKQVDSTDVPVSAAAGSPWVDIDQATAAENSKKVDGCTGCHLISEADWMTIAQNVLGGASNWSGGGVGSGYIYSGHNDGTPYSSLEADTSDTNGYYLTGNVANSSQRRTLTLSNGEVIWDFAGNVWEWTSGQAASGQPGEAGDNYNWWAEWNSLTTLGTVSPNSSPVGTGISGADSWTSANGIGMIISDPADTTLRGILRGGDWATSGPGVLSIYFNTEPTETYSFDGFRVAK